jgi:serine/threonine protein phosphatase PrpC
MICASGVSVLGPNHADSLTPNQDAIGIWGWRGGWIMVVCDGLGSKSRSDVGARIAARAARKVVRARMRWDDLRGLVQDIYQSWLDGLGSIKVDDAATTFLLAVCEPSGRAIAAQLGDGIVLYSSNGQFKILTPQRTGFANQTSGLGITKSFSDWSIADLTLSRPGDGILLATDGISDDLRPERMEAFFRSMGRQVALRKRRGSKKWFRRQLESWPTPGHSDDKTLGMIVRTRR